MQVFSDYQQELETTRRQKQNKIIFTALIEWKGCKIEMYFTFYGLSNVHILNK